VIHDNNLQVGRQFGNHVEYQFEHPDYFLSIVIIKKIDISVPGVAVWREVNLSRLVEDQEGCEGSRSLHQRRR
jgi:hypothetical protein